MKINITIDEELLAKVDAMAKENYTSRSGLIAMGMNQFVTAKEMVVAIQRMSIAMEKIAMSGQIDEETKKELEMVEAIARLTQRSFGSTFSG